jgi:small conductance mechanosensitive channel
MIIEKAKEVLNWISPIFETLESWRHVTLKTLPSILLAVLVFWLSVKIAKRLKKGVSFVIHKTSVPKTLQPFFIRISYIVFLSVGFLVSMDVAGLDKAVSSILAGVGVVGLAVGFAFQDIIANFMSGLMILFNKTITTGELIEVNGKIGVVKTVSIRATTIRLSQGQDAIIPNKELLEHALINYTRQGSRRVDVTCGVAYDSDLEKVEKIVLDELLKVKGIDTTQNPGFWFIDFGDSSINFHAHVWMSMVDADPTEYFGVQNSLIKLIKSRFEKEGVEIPYPTTTVLMNQQ